MTQRERFFFQMSERPTLPCLNWEFTYWETTLPEWHKQGLPKEVDSTIKAYRYFGIEGFHFDEGFYIPGGNLRLCPGFEAKFLGIDDGVAVHLDGDGVKFAKIAEGQSTIPHYLDYPVKGRRDWNERYKPRLDPGSPCRFPDPDWDAVNRSFDASGKPVGLYLDSYIGYLRNLMGFEAGVNILMPCEVDAGMDILMLQERYGDRCGFHGGIQKKVLAEGKDAIDRELRRVLPAVQRGGYIPHLDHGCPSNVPLENYRYYINRKREILGCGGGTPAAAI